MKQGKRQVSKSTIVVNKIQFPCKLAVDKPRCMFVKRAPCMILLEVSCAQLVPSMVASYPWRDCQSKRVGCMPTFYTYTCIHHCLHNRKVYIGLKHPYVEDPDQDMTHMIKLLYHVGVWGGGCGGVCVCVCVCVWGGCIKEPEIYVNSEYCGIHCLSYRLSHI